MSRQDIAPDFMAVWRQEGGFDGLFNIGGELYRQVAGRRTLRFSRDGRSFFIKIHAGVGWKEIFKNLFSGRLPVLGAKNEYQALLHLERAGVATPGFAAYAQRGCNPARLHSFVVTEDLGESTSLEDLCRPWKENPPAFAAKRNLIEEVADIARRLHDSGANHRDFYLCHFLRRHADGNLYLIDLHRVQLRHKVPRRWLIKDLAGLYFSAMDIGLTQRDLLRFIRAYRSKSLREVLQSERSFWNTVAERAMRLYTSPIR